MRRRVSWGFSVALAGILAAAASASSSPAGFARAGWLEPAASYVAAKPVAVWCARSERDWDDSLLGRRLPLGVLEGYGSAVGGGEMFLAPWVCDPLSDLRFGRRGQPWLVGSALTTVAHEAFHLAGVGDESEADCRALRVIAKVAILFFGERSRPYLRKVTAAAWAGHRTAPERYRTLC